MIKVKPLIPKRLGMFAPAAHRKAIERTMAMATEKAQAEIATLTRGWSSPPAVDVRQQGDATLIEITDKRWRYLDEGTKAHAIIARRKRALFWPGASHPVRSVRHPGIKARYLTKKVQAKVDALNLAGTFANLIGELTR